VNIYTTNYCCSEYIARKSWWWK